jgi:hypothetical protein
VAHDGVSGQMVEAVGREAPPVVVVGEAALQSLDEPRRRKSFLLEWSVGVCRHVEG